MRNQTMTNRRYSQPKGGKPKSLTPPFLAAQADMLDLKSPVRATLRGVRLTHCSNALSLKNRDYNGCHKIQHVHCSPLGRSVRVAHERHYCTTDSRPALHDIGDYKPAIKVWRFTWLQHPVTIVTFLVASRPHCHILVEHCGRAYPYQPLRIPSPCLGWDFAS